ncbi:MULTISPECIES: glycoside hydrolase family 31 protein [unclassified Crossiella]|uniref:glycoside hydrolase family 31 protein n=1 Tax=unclassified Crossiella TaxID=2620835 RepID=UPI001FFF9A93|nr:MULTISPECIES: glycoside hydrolase family 31 protein [unclassified Crossiella]MCK2243104.1 hypothetical protein [Crossiella sp. S99.2]MCK2256981.1 hypothetical protein [Crossiella sp. S99.1]
MASRRRGFRRLTVFGAALAVTLASTGAAGADSAPSLPVPDSPVPEAEAAPPSWRAEPSPFRLSFRQGHRQLTAQLADPTARMVYQLADGSTHHLTDLRGHQATPDGTSYTVATTEPGRTATVAVARTPRGLRVDWTFSPATGVTRVSETLTGSPAEHFLGGGAHTMFTDLRGKVLLNKAVFVGASNFGKCNKNGAPTPFFLSSHGYAVYPDTVAIGRIAFPGAQADTHCEDKPAPCPVAYGQNDRIQLCFKDDHLSYEVYGGSPDRVTRSYFQRVGLPTLPPPRQFALMKWRDKYNTQAEVIEDAVQFQAHNLPLDTVWIDNPWEQGPEGARPTYACIGALSFDKQVFPDAQGMIDDLKRRGVNLGVWVAPFLAKQSDGKPCPHDYPPNSFVQSDRTNVLDLDLTNPATRAHYEAKLEKVFRMGVNMVKGDRGEEHNFEESTFAGGPGRLLHNRYPLLYAESVARALRKAHGDNYTMLFRAGYDGMPTILRGAWMADADMSFDGLRLTLRRGVNNGMTGHPVWGSDTGGYRRIAPDSPSPSLFTRWAQLSAVSPVFQVGGPGRNGTPWVYDADTLRRFRDAAKLHYELFPYLFEQARLAAATGVPITRPMPFEHPREEAAWTADQQFMVGPDLLAAPVTEDRAEADGAAGKPTPVRVWLPKGDWIDLHSGQTVTGDRTIVRESTVDEFPLYLRAGAAIGFNQRGPQVWAKAWGTNDLDRKDRAGWLVSADGGARAENPYGGKLTSHRVGKHLVITLRDAPAETQLTLPGVNGLRAAYLDGRPAAKSTVDELRGRASGWTTTTGAFGGTVVKLRPHNGISQVVLTLP